MARRRGRAPGLAAAAPLRVVPAVGHLGVRRDVQHGAGRRAGGGGRGVAAGDQGAGHRADPVDAHQRPGGGAAVERHAHLPLGDRGGGDPGVDVDAAQVVGLGGQRLAPHGRVVERPLGHRVPAGGASVGGAGAHGHLDDAVAGGDGLPRGDERGGAEAGARPRRRPAAGLVGAAVQPSGTGLLEQQRALRGPDAPHRAGAPVAALAPRGVLDARGGPALGGRRHAGLGGRGSGHRCERAHEQREGRDGEERASYAGRGHPTTLTRSDLMCPRSHSVRSNRCGAAAPLDLPGESEAPRHGDPRSP